MATPTPMPTDEQLASAAISPFIAWFGSPPGQGHERIASTLTKMWVRDPELAVAAARMPFYDGSITFDDQRAIDALNRIAEVDRGLAVALTKAGWFADGISDERSALPSESLTVEHLLSIARANAELARAIGETGLVADALTEDGQAWLGHFSRFGDDHPELAAATARAHWVAGDAPEYEPWVVAALHELADYDRALARQLLEYISEEPFRNRNLYMLDALRRMNSDTARKPDLERLVAQPWSVDGWNAEERARINLISYEGTLVDEVFSRSSTITSPLSGEIALWVFQAEPFPSGDDTLEMLEEVVRGAERLMGVPFPTTDVILRISDPAIQPRAYFDEDHIVVPRVDGHVRVDAVFHETGHYYFHTRPRWLGEGGAELVEWYVRDQLTQGYLEDLAQLPPGAPLPNGRFDFLVPYDDPDDFHTLQRMMRRAREILHAPDSCLALGVRDIQSLSTAGAAQVRCTYSYGTLLLGSMYFLFGEEAFRAALQEVYLRSQELLKPAEGGPSTFTAEELFDIFRGHVPSGLEQEFCETYKRIHGGPSIECGR